MRTSADLSSEQPSPGVAALPPTSTTPVAVDDYVAGWFRNRADRTGHPDFQALINAALHDYICRVEEPLERTLRRVLRDELRKAG